MAIALGIHFDNCTYEPNSVGGSKSFSILNQDEENEICSMVARTDAIAALFLVWY